MSTTTTTEPLAPAILSYLTTGAFPTSDTTSSAVLSATTLPEILSALHAAQASARADLAQLSRTAAPDVDAWIAGARALRDDLGAARATAAGIVERAGVVEGLKGKAEDARGKVGLLGREIAFVEELGRALAEVREVDGRLDRVRDEVVRGGVGDTLGRLREVEGVIEGMRVARPGSSAAGLLVGRAEGLRRSLGETAVECWNGLVRVRSGDGVVVVRRSWERKLADGKAMTVTLEEIASALQELALFDQMVGRLAKDIDACILRPRFSTNADGTVFTVKAASEELKLEGTSEETDAGALLRDLGTIVNWLSERFPPVIGSALSKVLIPKLIGQLEEWLEGAIPLEVSDIPAFDTLLDKAKDFAALIDRSGWSGAEPLLEWVKNAPRTWLSKKREALLGEARTLVFRGPRERKEVERVETQVVSKEDTITGHEGGDEWDTAWDDSEEQQPAGTAQHPSNEDDDDGSAWDMNDADNKPNDGNEDDEAWGWDDGTEHTTQQPPANSNHAETQATTTATPAHKANEREMTLRETFTVTLLPDALIELIQRVITDAETLAKPEYSSSVIAPVSAALYTLPTLALAIYRATAPTTYSKVDVGSMLIYNDASHLSDQLRSWQASQPAASRLRLDSDVKALDQFAKRAYSAEMESQRVILRDLLDGAQGFSNCIAQPYKAECESAVEQTVHRLREVDRQWGSVLSPSARLQSVGSLAATVMGKMITEVEDLPDIGDAESKQLKLFCETISSIRDLFTQTGPDGGEAKDLSFIYCPNWLKFQYLAEIMESSLADIKYLWNEGELSLEYEAEEVVGLIEALFADSGLRRSAINEIRRGAR